MKLKTSEEIKILRDGGQRLARILVTLAGEVKPGLSGRALDARARELIAEGGDRPSFLHYRAAGAPGPYPAALCVSTNNCIVHGIPNDEPFNMGDVVSLDLGLEHGGLFTDAAITVSVGEPTREAARLIKLTAEALVGAIRLCRPGHRLGDIGAYLEEFAKREGLGLVTELGGHGVGHKVHEEPHIANFGTRGTGEKLKPGMVLAIEPMFTLGSGEVIFDPDGYTVTTADGSLAAHFEHTIAITEDVPQVLTEA